MFSMSWKKAERYICSFTRYVIEVFLSHMLSVEAISQGSLQQVRIQIACFGLSHLTGLELDIRDNPLSQLLHFLAIVLLDMRVHLREVKLFIRRHQ